MIESASCFTTVPSICSMSVVLLNDDDSHCSLLMQQAAGFDALKPHRKFIALQVSTKDPETKWLNMYELDTVKDYESDNDVSADSRNKLSLM